MTKIIGLFFIDFLKSAIDYMGDMMLTGIIPIALYAENSLKDLGIDNITALRAIFLKFGIALIVLKFLKKGFDTYILWTDGDPDSEPAILVVGFFKAMALALCFPVMYGWLVNIINELSNKALKTINTTSGSMIKNFIIALTIKNLFYLLCIVIFIVLFVYLFIKFIQKGLEIFIMRIGFPIVCSGLMDANGGIFTSYLQVLIQVVTTVLVQVLLAKLSLVLLIQGNVLWGLAALLAALKTPRLLDKFLIPSGGGSMINTAYSATRLFNMIRR
jgi:hypothetical protein